MKDLFIQVFFIYDLSLKSGIQSSSDNPKETENPIVNLINICTMTLQIRTKLLLVVITLVSNSLFANDGGAAPFTKTSSATFLQSVKKFDAEFNVLKVCACQVLKVKSNNESLENIAVFSEKINNGDLSADFSVAKEVLEKEKKQMKFFFYDKVTVVNKIVVATDCKTLYKQLKVENDDLKMYELLDADIKSRFYNLNK